MQVSYSEYLRGLGRSAKTVAEYQREIDQADAWFSLRRWTLRDATPSQLVEYADTRPNTPGVRAHLRSALHHYWDWHEVRGFPGAIRVPSLGPMLCKALSVPETLAITSTAKGWWRAGTAVLVGVGLGLRNAEIASMRWDGFDQTCEWYTCVGKGSRQRTLAVPSRLAVELDGHQNWHPYVFEGRFGGPVSHGTIWNWVRQVAEVAGIESDVWPHRLRHTFGATANDDTKNLRAVQAAMGHAKVETTAGYTRATATALREVADAINRYL